ncbi:hypothetical protein TcCL_Unassigned01772 [Trypanosoma cruzi]|nr:hypothetical protein TcCL_Unassigned01772 [Trypanosoma cruzi]
MNFARPEGNWEKERIPRGGIPVPARPIHDHIPCLWNAVCQVNQRPRREGMRKLSKVAVTPPAHTKSAGRNGQLIPMPRHPRLPRSTCTHEGSCHGGGALEDKCGTWQGWLGPSLPPLNTWITLCTRHTRAALITAMRRAPIHNPDQDVPGNLEPCYYSVAALLLQTATPPACKPTVRQSLNSLLPLGGSLDPSSFA